MIDKDTVDSIRNAVKATDDGSRADLLEMIVRMRSVLMALRLIEMDSMSQDMVDRIKKEIVPSIDTTVMIMAHRLGYDAGAIMTLTFELFEDIAGDVMKEMNDPDKTKG